MRPEDTNESSIGALIGLVVHDLRNPTSTIGANLAYLREVAPGDDEDAREALSDSEVAVGDLMRGLEQLAWIGRWFRGEPAVQVSEGDVAAALKAAADKHATMNIEVDAPSGLRARGGGSLARLVEVLLSNSAQHARGGKVRLTASPTDEGIVVEVQDQGPAIHPDLREAAFTLDGQQDTKSRADGRYGRVAALFAARVLAESMGARLEADGEDGAAVFRVVLPRAS